MSAPAMIPSGPYICPEHGEYRGHGTSCDECARAARAAESAWEAEWRRWQRYLGCGIPKRFCRATLDTWAAESVLHRGAKAAALRWCESLVAGENAGDGLTLSGPPGVGKTHLACGVILHVLQHSHVGARYVQWTDALAEIKGSHARRDKAASEILDSLKTTRVLVMDELAVRQGTEFDTVTLFDVIDYRYREQLPTIVCTNANVDSLGAVVGDRVADRLRETNDLIQLPGPSLRTRDPRPVGGPLPIAEPPCEISVPDGRWGRIMQRRIKRARIDPASGYPVFRS